MIPVPDRIDPQVDEREDAIAHIQKTRQGLVKIKMERTENEQEEQAADGNIDRQQVFDGADIRVVAGLQAEIIQKVAGLLGKRWGHRAAPPCYYKIDPPGYRKEALQSLES